MPENRELVMDIVLPLAYATPPLVIELVTVRLFTTMFRMVRFEEADPEKYIRPPLSLLEEA
jgi:hypothetical protein